MFRKTVILIWLSLAMLMLGCSKGMKFNEPAPTVNIDTAKIYYTQFSLFHEKNNFRTTNYRKGLLLPINTAVTLQIMDSKEAQIRLVDGGQILTIENAPKYTLDDMQTAFNKIAKPDKIDLRRFSADERDAILAGRAIKGMSREAVTAAIGYPPQHETPSLNVNDWLYWRNRFDRFIVHFKNDKVESIAE